VEITESGEECSTLDSVQHYVLDTVLQNVIYTIISYLFCFMQSIITLIFVSKMDNAEAFSAIEICCFMQALLVYGVYNGLNTSLESLIAPNNALNHLK
jgi:hypothetical protein